MTGIERRSLSVSLLLLASLSLSQCRSPVCPLLSIPALPPHAAAVVAKPLLVGFQRSGVYDPYLVLSGPAATSPTPPALLAAIEASVAGAAGGGAGTGGTLAGPEPIFCGVLSIEQHAPRGDDFGGGGDGMGGE